MGYPLNATKYVRGPCVHMKRSNLEIFAISILVLPMQNLKNSD